MSVHVFGIRHHGPGCARALRDALAALGPDIVLVEGPPDAHEVLPLLTNGTMRPPVALLIYAPETPQRAVFYPFTVFSPEWQALSFALTQGVPARFIDLPQTIQFAQARTEEEPPAPAPEGQQAEPLPATEQLRDDPIGVLAEAAGYTDHELWWEHQIEQRRDATDLFGGIMEAMTALRTETEHPEGREALREAHMRQAIRAARREGFQNIAVVCGAWHAPVLADPGTAKADSALLSGLPRVRIAATWIPWTNSRLSYRSGYGAGVRSPGWYDHLWTAPDRHAIRWVSRAAHLLREADLDASSSNVIEAVRLGEALAALRGLPMPGLAELHEAIRTTLCNGDETPMRLIRDRLEIGETLGAVPEETPAVPLQRDLAAAQRRLRLPPNAEIRPLDLDLRNENDRTRSHLLHRLTVLAVPWGKPQTVRGKSGTFHELWTLQWQPEFAVAVIEANVWGNTIPAAATAALGHRAETTTELPHLTALLDSAILAALPDATAHLLTRVRECAALSADVQHLMAALPPLARIARYGDVRETPREAGLPVIDGLFARVLIGLPNACATLDDDAATAMVEHVAYVEESLSLLDNAEQRAAWQWVLRGLTERQGVHGLVRGRACRLLLDTGVLDATALHRLARLALSPVTPAAEAAAWITGVVHGSAVLLLHQDSLWHALDDWLRDLRPETFIELLPLLRRAFAEFQPPERRAMGEKVRDLRTAATRTISVDGDDQFDIDRKRADRVLPVLAHILGVAGAMAIDEMERLRRWRLILSKDADSLGVSLSGADAGMDRTLAALYGGAGNGGGANDDDERSAGLGSSAPNVNRWLGDIRSYFPSSVVQVMQRDALERLNLTRMLLEPELLAAVEADVHLVGTLLSLSKVIPERTKETARHVVRTVVADLERRLARKTIQAVRGSLHRATRTRRPRHNEIDWDRTIRANLKHYSPERKTIVAERLIGYGHKRPSLRDIVLCVDQSGSMAASVVYAGVFGAVLASIRAVSTRMVVFDTAVVDLTEDLHDPVDLLFGTQLGGGTDINRALAYCQGLVTRPAQTILVLITDLYEGGNAAEMRQRAAALVASGVQVICLLALSDKGTPAFDQGNAAALAALGIPTFACTPDQFPDLMAAAINRRDLTLWAAQQEIVTAR